MAQCPVCRKAYPKKTDIITHVEAVHKDDIPAEMSTAQFIYMQNHNGRTSGICRYCKKLTPWNEAAGKPYQICGSPACKEKNKQIAQERMMRVYGKTNLLSDPKHQEKMLAGRSISGTYRWSDGKHSFTYTGTYEKFAIEWLDKVYQIDPDTVQMPGPIIEYELRGEKKHWITDMYLTEFNLVVEIKDGKDENTHPGFAEQREREKAKDEYMKTQKVFNYVKVTHKNMMLLLSAMSKIRLKNITSTDEEDYNSHKNDGPLVVINETANLNKTACKLELERLQRIKQEHLEADDRPSFWFENIDKQIEKYTKAIFESVSLAGTPLGKQRKTIQNGVELVKLLPNEAAGHIDDLAKVRKMLENPNNVYPTSDIHIGRPKLSYNPDIHLSETINRINASVPDDGLLIFLGDVVTSKDTEFVKKYTKLLLDGINTKNVVLILGNNDHLSVKEYYDLGFMYVSDRLIHNLYHFSHYPENVAVDTYNIHGHIHGYDEVYNVLASNKIDVYWGVNLEQGLLTLAQYLTLHDAGHYNYIKSIYRDTEELKV